MSARVTGLMKAPTMVRLSVQRAKDGQWFVRATRSGRRLFATETYPRRATAERVMRNTLDASARSLFVADIKSGPAAWR